MKSSKQIIKTAMYILGFTALISGWQGKGIHADDLVDKLAIDQQTHRRVSRTGVVAVDREKAAMGYILFTPMNNTCGEVFLIDTNDGKVVHQWNLPYAPGVYGYLLPNGNLFYNGQVEDDGAWICGQTGTVLKGAL